MHIAPPLPYTSPQDLRLSYPRRVPIAIVGAGLVGLTLALDLARRGVSTVVLEARDNLIEGSRAIVFAQRSLEILSRLGLGARLLEKGVSWRVGRVYHQGRELFNLNFQPHPSYRFPPFVNIQQSYVEEWLVEAARATGLVDLRALNRVIAIEQNPEGATITVATPDGTYMLSCDWLIACDGARSFVRGALQLPLQGKMFPDRFLIVDVRMEPGFEAERRFWFDPPFHPGRAVLLHKQPDNLWRVDFQLGPDADPAREREPERVKERLQTMLGPETPFNIDWISVYSFRCRRLERFVHSRILFVGDSAHEVSPFGGRGGNGGIQDADNVGWKLAAIVRHGASHSLIRSYDEERTFAADENIHNSMRSARFISPESPATRMLREATLKLSRDTLLGKALVNSGRLSRPAVLTGTGQFMGRAQTAGMQPGTAAADAPVQVDGQRSWLLDYIGRAGFTLLIFEDPKAPAYSPFELHSAYPHEVIAVCSKRASRTSRTRPRPWTLLWDEEGLVAERYELRPGELLLFRPDQHLLARFDELDEDAIALTMTRVLTAFAVRQAVEAVQ